MLRIFRWISASSASVSMRMAWPRTVACQYPLCAVMGTITFPVTSPPSTTTSAL